MTMLSLPDRTYLAVNYPEHEVWAEDNHVCVALQAFPLEEILIPVSSDLLVRLPGGYPERRPDMFWFLDPIRRVDGRAIPAIAVPQTFGGRVWYRWSRHMVDAEWRSTDGLRGYIAYVKLCLREASKVAA